MKKLLEIFFIVLVLLIANVCLFIFWWILTEPSNYLWEPVSAERLRIVTSVCSKIFWTKYYTWTLVTNLLTFSFLFYIRNKSFSISLSVLAFLVYTCSWLFFEPFVAQNYVILFEQQAVSPSFITEPIKQSGNSAGAILLERIENPEYPHRYYAIKALGEIRYAPAAERLGKILLDGKESEKIRGASFIALKSIRSKLSSKYLLLFSQLMLKNEKDKQVIQRLENENAY